jgi:DNA-binding response OmpR family regulator
MASILLVEDADRIASFVVKGLQSHGFDCTRATSGEEALSLVSAVGFDLVILDIGLPGIDGFEVLRTMRGQGFDVPVIVLTARDSVDNTVASFTGGADDYMGKPFSFDELLARVKIRLRKTSGSSSGDETLEVGSVSLDVRSRRVTRAGEEHDLTTREFGILEFLMRHPGQVVSREQLLSRVWSYDHDPQSNVVDVYIRYLRSKLGSEVIETVRGVGYRMLPTI